MKSWKIPTLEQVAKTLALITPHRERYRYFFERLQNPEWLQPLNEKGFFKKPPQPIIKTNSVQIPFWPESSYLARMARMKPELVMRIISDIQDSGNVFVYENFVDAALNMPPKVATGLLTKVKKWLDSPYIHSFFPVRMGDLVIHYAIGGEVEAAFDLAKALFEVIPDPKKHFSKSDTFTLPPDPKVRYNIWDYAKNIKKCIPELDKLNRDRTLTLLCDLLEKAIRYSRRKIDADSDYDGSIFWREEIEGQGYHHLYDLKDILINEVRDVAARICKENPQAISKVVEGLESRHWKIFQRIALHLLRSFSDKVPELADERVLNARLFNDSLQIPEYDKLFQERFKTLPTAKQSMMLDWIEKGPHFENKDLSDEERTQSKMRWQVRLISRVKEDLNDEARERFRDVFDEIAKARESVEKRRTQIDEGIARSKNIQEIKAMSISELINYIKAWCPVDEPPFESSVEQMGRMISSVIAESPAKYADTASDFRELTPTYVRSVIAGFRDAVSQNLSFQWGPVLDLCQWVLAQPPRVSFAQAKKWEEADPDWEATKKTISYLLANGFDDGAGAIPIKLRQQAWDVLEPLTIDPEPTPEYEAKYGDSNMDPISLSYNTTRGEAMHAVIRYALWVRRFLEQQPDANERIARGFDEMKEVREVLDYHLDVSKDPSLAIRAVYGQWFPWLVLLDKNWVKTNLPLVFPQDQKKSGLFWTAWDTYLIMNRAYDDVFEVLKGLYAIAVRCLGTERSGKRGTDPDEQLAAHLMTLYWRGKLKLDEPDGILAVFWKNASQELRETAIANIGRSLKETEGKIDDAYKEKLKALWSDRFEAAKKSPDNHKLEMAAFAFWFTTDQFDDEWLLEQLTEALKISGKVEIGTFVMEKLAKLFDKFPEKIIECIEWIVRGDLNVWILSAIAEQLKPMLSKALKIDSVKLKAREIIESYLLPRGYFEYLDLLKDT